MDMQKMNVSPTKLTCGRYINGLIICIDDNVVYGIDDPSEKLFLTRSLKLVGTSTLLYVELRSRDPLRPG